MDIAEKLKKKSEDSIKLVQELDSHKKKKHHNLV